MKKVILSLAFSAFGVFSMAQQTQTNAAPKQRWDPNSPEKQQKFAEMQKKHLDEMTKDLNLTPDQVSQIQTLQNKQMADRKTEMDKQNADRQARMQQMLAKKDQYDSQMKNILTPDQYTKWQAKRDEMMKKRRDKMMQGRGHARHGMGMEGDVHDMQQTQPETK